jgi:hypothetical protein
MPFTPITIDQVRRDIMQQDQNCPVLDKANLAKVLMQIYNEIGVLKTSDPNIDIKKA